MNFNVVNRNHSLEIAALGFHKLEKYINIIEGEGKTRVARLLSQIGG